MTMKHARPRGDLAHWIVFELWDAGHLAAEPHDPGFRAARSVVASMLREALRPDDADPNRVPPASPAARTSSDTAAQHLWREPHRDYAGRTCTTGLLHSHEAAAATPSLDWSRVITAVANTMPDDDTFARPEVVAAEYARLDEGSATPPRIREVVGQGDGTMIVTLDDGTERRITEREYLDWPRDEGSAIPAALDLEELRRRVEASGIRQEPWELHETEGSFTPSIFGRHPGEDYEDDDLPCRITTGGDFDDVESARLAVAAVNALPYLLDELARLRGEPR